MLMFFNLNKNVIFDDELQERQNFNSYLALPLTNESIVAPQEFKDLLHATIAAIPGRDLIGANDPNLQQLIKYIDT